MEQPKPQQGHVVCVCTTTAPPAAAACLALLLLVPFLEVFFDVLRARNLICT